MKTISSIDLIINKSSFLGSELKLPTKVFITTNRTIAVKIDFKTNNKVISFVKNQRASNHESI
jgi:hypothetical protein